MQLKNFELLTPSLKFYVKIKILYVIKFQIGSGRVNPGSGRVGPSQIPWPLTPWGPGQTTKILAQPWPS